MNYRTVEQTAQLLNTTPDTIRLLILAGSLRAVYSCRRYRISESAITCYLRQAA
jgi:excisionase family DNA binding protein